MNSNSAACAPTHHRDPGEVGHRPAGAGFQLLDTAGLRAGFAQNRLLLESVQENGGLVGPDHPGVRLARGNLPRLGERQPGDQRKGRFPRLRRLVYAGRDAPKGSAHPGQEGAAIARSGGQNQLIWWGLQKQRLAPAFVLTGVGTGPIIRGPWQPARQSSSIAHSCPRKARCWSEFTRSADLDRLKDVLTDSRGVRSCEVCVFEDVLGPGGCEHRDSRGAAAAMSALHAGVRSRSRRRQRGRVC